MAKRANAKEIELSGGDAVGLLEEQVRRLRRLPAHGNRKLTIDQLFIALLLAFYNPIVRSQRLIEDCGDMNGALDLDRLARSTTSDALAVFDPEHLAPIVADLRQRVCKLRQKDDSLYHIAQRIVAADGTYLTIFSDVVWALRHSQRGGKTQGQIRLNFQVDVQSWTPEAVSVSGDDGSEPAAFAADLLTDVLYVIDRNFVHFDFLRQLLAKQNNFVLRVRDNMPATRALHDLPISAADAEAGVVSDQIVTLTGRDAPQGEFRLTEIHTIDRNGEAEIIRLLSSLTDPQIPAKTIGLIYQQRWQIELFFKWLKVWANLDHLLSTHRQGITFQFYVAVIAVLLMYLQTGRRVSRYTLLQFQLLMHGQITIEQMMRTLARRERERTLARQRQAARRRQKKLP